MTRVPPARLVGLDQFDSEALKCELGRTVGNFIDNAAHTDAAGDRNTVSIAVLLHLISVRARCVKKSVCLGICNGQRDVAQPKSRTGCAGLTDQIQNDPLILPILF